MGILSHLRLLPAAAFLALGLSSFGPALAQDQTAEDQEKSAAEISAEEPDDRGFLTRMLERNLSGNGREVRIVGFAGALSSRATFQEITITDPDGAWLTLRNGAIQWDRSALLRRRVEIAELSAETIDLPRLPAPAEDAAPTAEAQPFSLPQLPVGVNIARLSAQRVNLGEALFGEAASVSVDGAMSLAGGEGAARLAINRVDGKRGVFAIDTSYSNETTDLNIDLTLDEDAEGIFANLVKLEGRPSVAASIRGQGPVTDFNADITLATDGQPRITGNVALRAEAGPDGAPGRGFRVRLGGDVATLVPEDQRAFFGSQSQLLAEGWRGNDGRLTVPVLLLDTDALNVSGSFATNAQNAPTNAVLMLTLGYDAGAPQLPVRLPIAGTPTTVVGGRLQLTYDSTQASTWKLEGNLAEFKRPDLAIGTVLLNGGGPVELADGALARLGGQITFDTTRIAPRDAGLASAIGPTLKGQTSFDWTPGNALQMTGIDVTGADYGLRGDLTISGLSSGLTLNGALDARYDDLSRLAQIADRPVAGRTNARVSGSYTVLSRAFDAEVQLQGSDLTTGQPQLDRLLAGNATVNASARRDETGIQLRRLDINGQRLTANASGTLSSAATDINATIGLRSLAEVSPDLGGTLQADARLSGPNGQRQLVVNGQAVDLSTGIEAVDGALRGETELAVNGREARGPNGAAGFVIETLRLVNPQLSLTGQGNLTPGQMDATMQFSAADLGRIAPGWAGSFDATGRIIEENGGRRLTVDGTGEGLRFGPQDTGGAGTGTTRLTLDATQATDGSGSFQVDRFDLTNDQITASVSGPIGPDQTNLTGRADIRSLAALGRGWRGAAQLEGSFAGNPAGEGRLLGITGTTTDVAIGRPEVDGMLAGTTRLTVNGTENEGVFTIGEANIANDQATVSATGTLGQGAVDMRGKAAVVDLARLGRGWRGRVEAQGSFTQNIAGLRRFDVTGTGQDLVLGQAQADAALSGETRFTLRGTEQAGAVTLEQADIVNDQANVSATGKIGTDGTDLRGRAVVADLAPFGLGYRGSVDLTGSYADDGNGGRRIDVTGTGQDLAYSQGETDAALTGTTNLTLKATQGPEGFVIEQADLNNDQATVTAQGRVGFGGTDLTGRADIRNLAPFGPGWGGALQVQGSFRDDNTGGRRLEATGTGTDLRFGQQQLDGVLQGQTTLNLRGVERDGIFTIEAAEIANPQARATASGTVGRGVTAANARIEMPSLAPLGPGYRGAVVADATLNQDDTGTRQFTLTGTGTDLSLGQTQVDTALAGETRFDIAGSERGGTVTLERAVIDNPRLSADANGTVAAGNIDINARVDADSIAFLGNGLRGGLTADGTVRMQGDTLNLTAQGEGRGLGTGNAQADALLGGTTSFDVAATRQGTELSIERLEASNPQLRITADGALASGINLDARLADVALLVPGFPGPAEARGTVRRNGDQIGLDVAVTAPGSTQATISGTAAQDFSTADIRVNGSADSALANPFLRVRSIEGPVNFDLRLNGPPALQSLSGTVNLPAARLSDPRLGLRVDPLRLDATFNGGTIAVNGAGTLADGGSLAVDGSIGLEGARPIDLAIRLDGAALRDPNLYETSVTGTLNVGGTLGEGPLIAGTLNLGTTEIRIPSTGLGGAKDILQVMHLGDRPPVRSTRAKAGLIPYPSAESVEAGLAGPPATPPAVAARLDITINAPNQIFVRGRGVDAEFGGTIRITGNAREVVPIGFLELIRGRVDLLGKRFDLAEGLLELQGSLMPVIRLVATTEQDGITTSITIEGEANDPDITFTSNPDLPQEEVLSQLLFGRGLENISALQAAQLANAVAVLAGRGGEGIVSRLRNQVGLDDLDLATDEEGNVSVRAGKYLTENIYTDVSVGGDGQTSLNINLDVSDDLTARGSIDNEGDSSIGLFYERDY